jgi:hypothetical protein
MPRTSKPKTTTEVVETPVTTQNVAPVTTTTKPKQTKFQQLEQAVARLTLGPIKNRGSLKVGESVLDPKNGKVRTVVASNFEPGSGPRPTRVALAYQGEPAVDVFDFNYEGGDQVLLVK